MEVKYSGATRTDTAAAEEEEVNKEEVAARVSAVWSATAPSVVTTTGIDSSPHPVCLSPTHWSNISASNPTVVAAPSNIEIQYPCLNSQDIGTDFDKEMSCNTTTGDERNEYCNVVNISPILYSSIQLNKYY